MLRAVISAGVKIYIKKTKTGTLSKSIYLEETEKIDTKKEIYRYELILALILVSILLRKIYYQSKEKV